MTDSYEVEMSSLSQTLTEKSQSVDVEIYRGDKGGWILEVIDAQGTSHIWDEEFPTDQEALDAVKETIEVEGIETFTTVRQ